MAERNAVDSTDAVAYVNVTDAQGILLGRFALTADDLQDKPSHLGAIGRRVLDELPSNLKRDGGES